MVVSHTHQFVILGIPKTATHSVSAMFSDYHDVLCVNKIPSAPLYPHATSRNLRKGFAAHGWDWDSYYKVAIVRNPWDRFLSAINFIKDQRKDLLAELGGDDDKIFYNIVRAWSSQFDYFLDSPGIITVDQIIQFESIEEGLATFMATVGVRPGLKLPHLNPSTKQVNSADVYSDAMIKEVAHKEWRLVEMFDYKFEQKY